jgi:hypothetical protein
LLRPRRDLALTYTDDLSRIEDVLRIERALERAHEVHLRGALVAQNLVALHHADAVLGADRAAEIVDQIVDGARDLASQRARNASPSPPFGTLKLKWMLPSPRWPNGTGRAGNQRSTSAMPFSRNSGNVFHRHGNIVLDRGAFALLRFRHVLAQPPQRARCARSRRYASLASPLSMASRWRFDPRASAAFAGAGRLGSTYQGDRRASGSRVCGICASTNSSADARHQFEGGHEPAGRVSAAAPASDGGGRIAHGDESGFVVSGLGNSFSAAAVITPSVPSAPMKSCFRS